jgi:hypothetical protein
MKKYVQNTIFIFIFILAVVIYYNYDLRKTDEYFNELSKEYPTVTFEEKINAKVTKIFNVDPKIYRNNPYQTYIVLDNSLKKDIYAFREVKKELTLDEVIEIGDQLVKDVNNYTFFLFKLKGNDTLKYEFELRNKVRYPMKKNMPQ